MWSNANNADQPGWLTNANEDPENPSGKDWESAEQTTTSAIPGSTDVSGSMTGEATTTSDAKTSGSACCCQLSTTTISLLFLGAFIYAAWDRKGLIWYIFYATSAVIPATAILYHWLCFPAKMIYILCLGMAGWSATYIVLRTLKLVDEEDEDAKKDYIWEISELSLAFISAVYHAILVGCCINKSSRKDED